MSTMTQRPAHLKSPKYLTRFTLDFEHMTEAQRDELLNALLAQIEDADTVSFRYEIDTEETGL